MMGRVTLTKTINQVLPNNVMQTTVLPSSMCEEIDRSCRNCVWGHTTNFNKVHWRKWDSLCTPKKNGGLGLRQASIMNQTSIIKVGWKICTRSNDLWVQFMCAK